MQTIDPIKEGSYYLPTQVFFGRGIFRKISNLKQIKKSRKVLLVAGDHFKSSQNFKQLKSDLEKDERTTIIYDKLIAKSDFETVNALTDFCRRENPDLVIAIGGGTILDTAKCAAILVVNNGFVEEYVKDKTRKLVDKKIAFVACPTTAGTGSEVTPWATVWDTKNKDKYSLTSEVMFPEVAIVDPSLTDSLPARETAETGIDALSQAIEAYWSVKHNPVSDRFALKAIRLALESLEKAVNNPSQKLRDRMAKAALLSGLAFSNTQTTICHSVSYPITAYFGVSHGQAVAITLPTFIEYSLPAIDKKRREALLKALSSQNENEARVKIETLMEKIGLKTRLSGLGIKEADLNLIVGKGFHPDRAKNAPKIPTPTKLKMMLFALI